MIRNETQNISRKEKKRVEKDWKSGKEKMDDAALVGFTLFPGKFLFTVKPCFPSSQKHEPVAVAKISRVLLTK